MNLQQPTKVIGTTTDDDAEAGFVGEYLIEQLLAASTTTLTSTASKTIISLSGDSILTPGNWLVGGIAYFVTGATTSITRLRADISTADNTNAASDTGGSWQWGAAAFVPGAAVLSGTPGIRRIKVAAGATQAMYLVADNTFTVDIMTAFGTIWALRFR